MLDLLLSLTYVLKIFCLEVFTLFYKYKVIKIYILTWTINGGASKKLSRLNYNPVTTEVMLNIKNHTTIGAEQRSVQAFQSRH